MKERGWGELYHSLVIGICLEIRISDLGFFQEVYLKAIECYHNNIYMSIIDIERIGDWLKRNQADIVIVVGFVLVALIAFGAGRLSAPEIVRNPIIIDEPSVSSSINILGNVSQPVGVAAEQGAQSAVTNAKGLFVASKSGTKYHWPWCSYGQNIKLENQIWFNSETEAQTAGFSPCTYITSKAPAGYVKPLPR
ncbi:hypothetical protein KJ866_03980 [Patescibacteria group bacterium]|nr:hypothetical protein [Patescibacteria group bacterium]MBU2219636.1 hypothetical protein [Patescibacteria group bacterium]MBU2265186.1 hypothetical protein [Patescibacteria group bacterium]